MMMKMMMMTSYYYNDNNVEMIIIMCRSIQGFTVSPSTLSPTPPEQPTGI